MLSSTNTSTGYKKRNITALVRKSEQARTGKVLELVQKLQSSLEVEAILPHLLEYLRNYIPDCRLSYRYDEFEFNLEFEGPNLVHQCFYQLNVDDINLGEIRVTNSKEFSEFELQIIEETLTHLYFPLRNALLYQQAIRNARLDALTGVNNRFAFSRAFERELKLAHRYNNDLSLLILDIDHFKSVNDHYGHLCGDIVLRDVAQTIKAAMRETDMIFRYGGEEFTAILPKTDHQGALVIAERIRKEVEGLIINADNKPVSVTVSIGIGSLKNVESSDQLFIQADEHLYSAKRAGRNRVC
ncbi:GGDEF domain-containing protein [Sessilibacter sp. MAH4]